VRFAVDCINCDGAPSPDRGVGRYIIIGNFCPQRTVGVRIGRTREFVEDTDSSSVTFSTEGM
jgi:hypothetical protein